METPDAAAVPKSFALMWRLDGAGPRGPKRGLTLDQVIDAAPCPNKPSTSTRSAGGRPTCDSASTGCWTVVNSSSDHSRSKDVPQRIRATAHAGHLAETRCHWY